MLRIEKESVQSIFLMSGTAFGTLSTATGILAHVPSGGLAIITNRHVATGLHQLTRETLAKSGAVPDRLVAMIPRQNKDSIEWRRVEVPLIDDAQRPMWIEHPIHKTAADLAAIRVPMGDDWSHFTYDLSHDSRVEVGPGEIVSVVGFPFGMPATGFSSRGEPTQGFFSIWATGHIATDLPLDHAGLPVFLVDARSREGQSGSPVIFSRSNGMVPRPGGIVEMHTGRVTELLGLYSGRISKESDLGYVWKRSALRELLAAVPPS